MRVLVIDDEPDVLLLCRVNLEFSGHEVLQASDADQGIELAIGGAPDLIVLDVMLPSRDGLSVLRELASHPATEGTPVVLLTARTRRTDRLQGWEAGCAGYVTKPFAPMDLTETIEHVHSMSRVDRRLHREAMLTELRRRAVAPAPGEPSEPTR
ncbi:MAG TPA: response regulator [Actinomycetota bacterium]